MRLFATHADSTEGGSKMSITKVSATLIGLQLFVLPAYAQGAAKDNAHTYQGGPKTQVPHSMKAKKTAPTTGQSGSSGGHHYQGGPKTEVPHHMQDKK
jgi:hypothetical protein